MTSKRATRWDPLFVSGVEKVRPALDAWRTRRKSREPIPETLWREMVSLARAYHPSPVAQALRVNYTTLKRRALALPGR